MVTKGESRRGSGPIGRLGLTHTHYFSDGADDKRIHLQCRRLGFDPWVGKIPWRKSWQPTPVYCLENSMDRGAWWTAVHWGRKESDMTV